MEFVTYVYTPKQEDSRPLKDYWFYDAWQWTKQLRQDK